MMKLYRSLSRMFSIFLVFASGLSITKPRERSKSERPKSERLKSNSPDLFTGTVIAWDLHDVLFFGKPSLLKAFWNYPHKRKLLPSGKMKKVIWKEVKRSLFGSKKKRLNASELITLAQEYGAHDIADFVMQYETSCAPDPDMVELIKELHDQGYRQCVCSNISAQGCALLQEQYPELFQYFDGIYTTRQNNSRKPHDRFFKLFLEEFNFQAADVLFIDDKSENCASARLVGIKAIRFSKHRRKRKQSIRQIKEVTRTSPSKR